MSAVAIETTTPEATMAFGSWLGAQAIPGWVIGLSGDLGAGKTTFVKGFASALGAERNDVTSPTFTFLHVYRGSIPVYHLDLYRLENAEQVRDLGVEEFIGGDGAALVEWFENVPGVLPNPRLEIRIEVVSAEKRRIVVSSEDPEWQGILAKVETWVS